MADFAYNDPYTTYRFQVSFSKVSGTAADIQKAGFSSVSGLSVSVNTMDYREGNEVTTIVRKMPGLTKIGNVTFKWGMIYANDVTGSDDTIFKWLAGHASMAENGPDGGLSLFDITITMKDSAGEVNGTPTWTLGRCWPVSISLPELNAQSNSIAVTSMEVAVGTFSFQAPTQNYSPSATNG